MTDEREDGGPPHGEPAVTVEQWREGRSRHFVRVALIGFAAGLLAVLFRWSLHYAEDGRDLLLTVLHQHPVWGWSVLPLVGLVLGSSAGWMVHHWAPEAAGSGIPHIKGVLLHIRTMRWLRLLPVKFIGGVAVIGSGLSLGREGPTVQMGAAVANGLGRLMGVSKRTMPQLVAAGSGAGLAAAFNAPLAGFIFVLEELQREMSPLTYGGALVAAVCADIVTRTLTGQLPSLHIQTSSAVPLAALPVVFILGAVTALVAVGFNRCLLDANRAGLAVKRVPRWMLPGLAGVIVAVVAWWLPDAVGGGHPVAERLGTGAYAGASIGLLSLLLVAKFALTVISYGSGAPGGIFAPMLVIGALLGLITHRLVSAAWPSANLAGSSFAVIGMAAFFAASVRAPLTGMVLVLEMTGDYNQLFALAAACLSAYLVAEWMRSRPIYDALLEQDLERSGAAGARTEGAEPTHVTVGIQLGSVADGRAIRDVGFPKGSLVVAVERRGRHLAPIADTQLFRGDHVTVLVSGESPADALVVVELCRAR